MTEPSTNPPAKLMLDGADTGTLLVLVSSRLTRTGAPNGVEGSSSETFSVSPAASICRSAGLIGVAAYAVPNGVPPGRT